MNYTEKLKNIFSDNCPIIGKEKFLNSAVLIPILILNDKEYVLFEKRSNNVRQPGEISFPGGHFDPSLDKDFFSTALRETSEELGLSTEKINIIGRLGTLVAPMGVIVETFVGYLNVDNLNSLDIDKKEVDRVFILPLEFFVNNKPEEYHTRLELHPYVVNETGQKLELFPVKELGLPERYANSWINGKHRVLVYKTSEEVIWGITAELIFELSKKLRN
ncbi:MAG: CoA pyrophosphatase [Ignavibacteriaceae bacterium]